tara:strand:+ start:4131 stop:4466 length:336 start_codon:yes stop_codon:yes gene_type:complete
MSKFKDDNKVKLTLVVAKDEADKTAFIKTLFAADTEVKSKNSRIISVADYKNNILYVFKKSSEGPLSLTGFDDCHEIQLTHRCHEDLAFYSKIAVLVNQIEDRNEVLENVK